MIIIIPTIIAAIIVYRKGAPEWMLWSVIGFGIFAWLCGKTYLNAVHNFEQGREDDEKVHNFWEVISSLVIWAQWIICIVAVGYSLVFLTT